MPKIEKASEPVKTATPDVESLNIRDLYKQAVASTMEKKTNSISSADLYKYFNELFDQSGEEALMFAPAQRVVKTLMGSTEKNFYNRAMSAVKAKTSPFETFDGEGGHIFIRRKSTKV